MSCLDSYACLSVYAHSELEGTNTYTYAHTHTQKHKRTLTVGPRDHNPHHHSHRFPGLVLITGEAGTTRNKGGCGLFFHAAPAFMQRLWKHTTCLRLSLTGPVYTPIRLYTQSEDSCVGQDC